MSVLVGICGGSGSGKTTLADHIVTRIRAQRGSPGAASVLSFDSYYHDIDDLDLDERASVNFDHPDSLDHELLVDHLEQLRAGRSVAVPVYDFAAHRRSDKLTIVAPSDVIVVEGILLFAFEPIRAQLDYAIFRRCPEPVRYGRRLERDVAERGRTEATVEAQFTTTVKPMHDEFVDPFADEADYVTEHGQDLDSVAEEIVGRVVRLATNPPAAKAS